jgi:hypothetical protein
MRRIVVGCAAALVALVAGAASAGAAGGPVETVSGSYQIPAATDDVTLVAAPAGNLFFHEVAPLGYTGGVSGTSTDVDNFVVHANGTYEGAGRESCSACTIDGRTGSYVASFNFQGSGDVYTGNLWTISTGGGLAGMHLGGKFVGTESGTGGTYSYQVVFAH